MTRFWITIDQAVDFVYQSFGHMHGQEIFVPKNPSVKTQDLAEAIAPGIKTETVGIREGEKLHESLISSEESRYTFEYKDYYLLLPPVYGLSLKERLSKHPNGGKRVPKGFAFTSDTNPETLTVDQLRDLILRTA